MDQKALNKMLAGLIRRDAETFPLPSLNAVSAKVIQMGSRRLEAISGLLVKSKGNALLTELYLTELISRSLRQIEGVLSIGPTFKMRVENLSDDTLQAMTNPGALIALAKIIPVEVTDARLLAHSLSVDGSLVKWLPGYERKQVAPDNRSTDAKQAYRRLAQRFHADKGGDDAIMCDLNLLRDAAK